MVNIELLVKVWLIELGITAVKKVRPEYALMTHDN